MSQKNQTPSEQYQDEWMNRKWRPAMGWTYMAVCICDFILFPILHAVYITILYKNGLPPHIPHQWEPLTLAGAGLFHIAMGAILGITAWWRSREKIELQNKG